MSCVQAVKRDLLVAYSVIKLGKTKRKIQENLRENTDDARNIFSSLEFYLFLREACFSQMRNNGMPFWVVPINL